MLYDFLIEILIMFKKKRILWGKLGGWEAFWPMAWSLFIITTYLPASTVRISLFPIKSCFLKMISSFHYLYSTILGDPQFVFI